VLMAAVLFFLTACERQKIRVSPYSKPLSFSGQKMVKIGFQLMLKVTIQWMGPLWRNGDIHPGWDL
jgi:hypothetical protein